MENSTTCAPVQSFSSELPEPDNLESENLKTNLPKEPLTIYDLFVDPRKAQHLTHEQAARLRDRFFDTLGVIGEQRQKMYARIDKHYAVETALNPDDPPLLVFPRELPKLTPEELEAALAERASWKNTHVYDPSNPDHKPDLTHLPDPRDHLTHLLAREQSDPALTRNLNLPPSPQLPIAHSPSEIQETRTPVPNLTPIPQSPIPERPSEAEMLKASNKYTYDRHNEYLEHEHNYRYWFHHHPRTLPPPYLSQLRQCPCGSQLPCPWHKPLPDIFWRRRPIDDLYKEIMDECGIPFRYPNELVA